MESRKAKRVQKYHSSITMASITVSSDFARRRGGQKVRCFCVCPSGFWKKR